MKYFCVSVSLHANLELLSTLNMKEKSETSVKGHKHQHNKRNVRLDLLHLFYTISAAHQWNSRCMDLCRPRHTLLPPVTFISDELQADLPLSLTAT